MNTTRHTAGPWKLRKSWLEPDGCFDTYALTQDNGDDQGLYLGSVSRSIPAGDANARLIAAAPELFSELESLAQAVRHYLKLPSERNRQRLLEMADGTSVALLAKAGWCGAIMPH